MPYYGSPAPPAVILRALFNGQDGTAAYSIGAASSTDGVWTEYGSNPIISKGAAATWDDDHVKDPCLLWDGSQFVVYFSGYDGTKYQVGRAVASVYSGPYTKYASNPVLAVGAGGAFDDAGVNFPTVLYEPTDTGKEWKMWYGANDGSVQSIGYAHSTDGLSWTKVGQVVTVGAGGTWEDEGVLPGAIYKDGATYNLFYAGRQGTTNPQWQGGLVTFTDPEGTYTKDAGNPLLLARFNDNPGTSLTLNANASPGATSVETTTTTAVMNVNEPVVLTDTDSETEVNRIAAIPDTSHITLESAVVGTFTTANSAKIRSFAENSVFPRTVMAAASGYQMFGAAFQPVEDLTAGGTKLREGSLRWTSATLDGTWAYDYDTGLLFPLYPATSGWHKFSAENPSVIVAP